MLLKTEFLQIMSIVSLLAIVIVYFNYLYSAETSGTLYNMIV